MLTPGDRRLGEARSTRGLQRTANRLAEVRDDLDTARRVAQKQRIHDAQRGPARFSGSSELHSALDMRGPVMASQEFESVHGLDLCFKPKHRGAGVAVVDTLLA